MQFKYTIKRMYGERGPETPIASCAEQNDAITLIKAKVADDAGMKLDITYRLYEMGELMQEFNQKNTATTSSVSGGQQQSNAFRPSPLQTAPRPSGMPASVFRDEKKDKS